MLKSKDMLILANLRSDARMSLTEMSKKINVPISTIFDKLKFFETSLIRKHTTLIDFSQLGYHTRANIALKVNKDDRDKIKEFLRTHQNVNSVYKINNGFDFLIEGLFSNIKDLDEFLENIESKYSISDKQIYYIVDEIKREEFLAKPSLMTANITPN